MDHINGEYDMEIHVADYRADKNEVWYLGTIKIWFKEGLEDATNEGLREEYLTQPIIEHYFRPEDAEKNIVVRYLNLCSN
jgi:hypothetical protein